MRFASAAPAPPVFEATAAVLSPSRMDRRFLIVVAVVGLHVLGLWALQAGLLRRAVELVIPVAVLTDMIQPPQPQQQPVPTPEPSRPRADTPKTAPAPRPATPPAPLPVAVAPATPAPAPEASAPAPAPATTAAPGPVTAMAPESTAPPAPPAPPKVELPSSNADYLRNPQPPYPALSKRLGEQGKVVIRAFIDADGSATRAEIRSSSGYERLDQAALQTVLKWRYVPGKRAGVPEGMWFNVPIHFILE